MQVSYRTDGSATVSFNNYGAGLVLGKNGGVKPFIKQVRGFLRLPHLRRAPHWKVPALDCNNCVAYNMHRGSPHVIFRANMQT